MTLSSKPRVLLVDSYDSFAFNLASLCKKAFPNCDVHIVKNDAISAAHLPVLLPTFHAVVVGPGPGSPEIPADIGVVKDLWHLADDLLLPIFGVCLGLQSLAIENGAQIRRLDVVKHGQISTIQHSGQNLFQACHEVTAVRYHSLHIELRGDEPLVPLAWADDGDENGSVLMALKHRTRPFWAVQYHPESICTDSAGEQVLRNFWSLASRWSAARSRPVLPWDASHESLVGPAWPTIRRIAIPKHITHRQPAMVYTRILHIPKLDLVQLCEDWGAEDERTDFALLDSAAPPGRFAILGCLSDTSAKITHSIGDTFLRIKRAKHTSVEKLGSLDVWAWLAAFMRERRAVGGDPAVPFWGGVIGYLSYELGVHTLSPLPPLSSTETDQRHPDVNLVFVERSIVWDKISGSVYVQSILPDDDDWLRETAARLEGLSTKTAAPTIPRSAMSATFSPPVKTPPVKPTIVVPERTSYINKVLSSMEYLFSGDSYELCVTAPTRVTLPKPASALHGGVSSSWSLYKVLRARNPAPHSAYIRLHPSTLLSSSPERFLSYSRGPRPVCQLRPIKGTVRKAPGIDRAVAERLLAGSRKEVAENLMIVDLIRHDLHSVVGTDVEVKQFCRVEEYETVWQLVSVIEGSPASGLGGEAETELGWEVLRASLPPGSMTGAPKKRSVEILRELEGAERGIYSGVLGYADVGGGGDWAVTIRSCFKYADLDGRHNEHNYTNANAAHDSTGDPHTNGAANVGGDNGPLMDEWTLGAGGAITALSEPEAEYEEMITKVESVLRAFNEMASTS